MPQSIPAGRPFSPCGDTRDRRPGGGGFFIPRYSGHAQSAPPPVGGGALCIVRGAALYYIQLTV